MVKDRKDAGKKLLALMKDYEKIECIVYGLPRGGVPVAYEIAVGLNKPLEVLIVKKLGLPGEEELALGAIAEGKKPSLYLNSNLMLNYGYSEKDMQPYIETKLKDISRLQQIFRKNEKMMVNTNGTAILVDDGISTGATVKAAIKAFKDMDQKTIVVASPVGHISVLREIQKMVDEVVCAEPVRYMEAVGEFYLDFSEVANEEACELIDSARRNIKGNRSHNS